MLYHELYQQFHLLNFKLNYKKSQMKKSRFISILLHPFQMKGKWKMSASRRDGEKIFHIFSDFSLLCLCVASSFRASCESSLFSLRSDSENVNIRKSRSVLKLRREKIMKIVCKQRDFSSIAQVCRSAAEQIPRALMRDSHTVISKSRNLSSFRTSRKVPALGKIRFHSHKTSWKNEILSLNKLFQPIPAFTHNLRILFYYHQTLCRSHF